MKLPIGILGGVLSCVSAYAQADLAIVSLDTGLVSTDSQTLRISGVLRATLTNAGTAATASRFRILAFEDTNRNGRYDAGVDRILGSVEYVDPISVGAKPVVAIPLAGTVAFRGNLIFVMADSDGAIAETNEANNVGNTGSAGSSAAPVVYNLAAFHPTLKWSWTSSAVASNALAVLSTPAVVDLNGDGVADVVFTAAYIPICCTSTAPGILRALDGRTGTELFAAVGVPVNASSSVAVGDIDGDGKPEIIAVETVNFFSRLLAFEHDGTLKWASDPIQQIASAGPSIADLDGDGVPEIIIGRQVLSNTGRLLWTGTDTNGNLFWDNGAQGPYTVIADVDLDGKQEVIAGRTVYGFDGQIRYTNPSLSDGHNAVANFNADPYPEIVHVSGGFLRLLRHDMSVIWGPIQIPGGAGGAAPTVADFDGDGQPEIAVLGGSIISVFETDGTLKFSINVREGSSGTGISAFDFNGDGAAEIVHRDDYELHVFKGTDGSEIFRTPLSSITLQEYPVIADVDADGHADIVVQASGQDNGIYVFSDPINSASAHPIWNQYGYSITNVNDDGTIPRNPTPNWLVPGLNNFRANSAPASGAATPDFTSSYIRKNDSGFPLSVQLTARVGNGGGETAPTVGPNLIQNGGFEVPDESSAVPFHTYLIAPPNFGWTLIPTRLDGSVAVDVMSNWWPGASGQADDQSLDIDYDSEINQLFPTVPGTKYVVSFYYAHNVYGSVGTSSGSIRITGASTLINEHLVHGIPSTPQQMNFVHFTREFTADANTTRLSIQGDASNGVAGFVVDAVEVRSRSSSSATPFVSFYRGDPATGGTLLGRTQTSKTLTPGDYEDVSITWNNPPIGLHSIFVVADDPAQVSESDEANNKSATQILLGSGPFPLVDELLTRQKDSSVDLSWVAISGATGYNVYRRTGTAAPQLIRANQTGISFTDTGLTNGTPVYYTVRWRNAQGQESADGTEASATPTPTGATGANPPTILSRAATRAVVGQPYSYAFRATDPDAGSVLVYSLVSPPAGMIISNTGLITWTPTQAQAGYSRIQVRVQDNTARFATQAFSIFAEIQTIINNPPVISSTPIRIATSGTLYAYQVVGSDPDGSFLTWSLDAAPLGMSINQGTGLIQWTPARDQVGTQNVTARVTDIGGLSVIQAFTITVARGNRGPSFISSALTIARAGELYQYPASATDPEGDPLNYGLVGGPAGMVVGASTGLVTWLPSANLVNTSVLVTLRVTDNGGLAATQAYTLRVTPPNQPPVITSTAVTKAAVGSAYAYQMTATDPNLPNDQLAFSLTTAPAGMSIGLTTGLIQWVAPGNLLNTNQNVTVRVADLGGLQAAQSFVIQVGPAGSNLPFVSLVSPINGSTLTADVLMTGTATDPNLRLWRVEYHRTGDTQWIPLSSGSTPVSNGSLGTFPATLLANDTYRLRLYAENTAGSITTPDIGVNVDTKQLKMGDFTLTSEDLRVPGFTFPISILRKYDSKRPQAGDFGPGWTLGFSEVDVRIDVNKNAFLTLPDGRRVSFTYTPECAGSTQLGFCLFDAYNTAYTGQSGVYDKLQSLDCPQSIAGGCGLGDPFDPRRWLLTTREGLKYTIDNGKVVRLEDRAGNWMQIGPTGVTSNTGRNVVIERNLQGSISKIKEPAPGGEMRYEYDGQGRLVRWVNLSAKTTTFFYENSGFPHYLTKIVDPLGRNALRNVFNAEGRLVAQCDAAGDIATLVGCSQFNPQPGTKTFTAINGRGFKTELVTDDRGNVLTERRYLDAVNHLDTVRTYDASNNMLTDRDPEGNVRTFTYDARGNRLTEADPGGRTTIYTYAAGCEKVATITDPAGNVTRNTYDAQCNLRFVQDALLKTTEYRYNPFGQRAQMIDPNGTTWTWNYLPNGLLQSVVDPFGKATTFSFDGKGNLLSRTDRNGRRIDFQYDASNRVTRETWGNGRVSTFGYDDLGALVTAADPDSSLMMTYDTLGRLQSVDNLGTPGAPRVVMTYSYDANGNTTQVQDSLGGFTNYSYDALDRLSRVTQSGAGVQPKRVDMTYSAASLLTQLRRFSDLAGTLGVANTNYEYDCGGCSGRLTAIRHRKASDNSVIHDLTFARDLLGNILSSTDAEGAHAYGYDPVRRLTSAVHPIGGVQPNEFYTYDAVGNRLTSHLSHVYTYSWQVQGKGNRLLQDNQFDYVYDDEGNLTRQTDRAGGSYTDFGYDYHNRMTTIVQKTTTGVELHRGAFTFDSVGRRIREVENSDDRYSVYDGQNPSLQIGATATRRFYLRGIDALLASETNGIPAWSLADEVGSVRYLLRTPGVGDTSYSYDAFGVVRSSGLQSDNDLLFVTREFDAAHGIGYFRARSYLPRLGRFLSEDSYEPYAYHYAENNPKTNVDRDGRLFIEFAVGTSVAVVVAAGICLYEARQEAAGNPYADLTIGLESQNPLCGALGAVARYINKTFRNPKLIGLPPDYPVVCDPGSDACRGR